MATKQTKQTFLFLIMILASGLWGQENTKIGFELQVYPTGLIPALCFEKQIKESSDLYFRLGANIFNHRDLGVQKEEKGSGIGFSMGYKSFFNNERKGLRWGLKNDIWFNKVEWKKPNNSDFTIEETRIIVLQPTVEISYIFGKGNVLYGPSLAIGAEWNVKTEGEPVGEGLILLIGFQLVKRI
jgi:hypothetical protein